MPVLSDSSNMQLPMVYRLSPCENSVRKFELTELLPFTAKKWGSQSWWWCFGFLGHVFLFALFPGKLRSPEEYGVEGAFFHPTIAFTGCHFSHYMHVTCLPDIPFVIACCGVRLTFWQCSAASLFKRSKCSWSSGCSWHCKALELEQPAAGGECASLNPGKCSCLWFVTSCLVLPCPVASCMELHALVINNEYINKVKHFCGWSIGPVRQGAFQSERRTTDPWDVFR